MIRTTKGQIFLDRLSVHKKFWRVFASIGLPAMLAGMLAMFILILLLDYFMIMSFQTNTVPPVSKFNEPRNIFLIPGINEYIPLWYGIIALIITLIVHEFSHAILCKVESIKVKSMGVLLAIVPIGGFAEPDEEQLLAFGRQPLGGAIRRYVATFRHRELGVHGNVLVAWNVPEARVEETGLSFAAVPEVSHCYARESFPGFPYSLYTMIHGPDEASCRGLAADLSSRVGIRDYLLLPSRHEFKKCRLRYFLPELDAWWEAHRGGLERTQADRSDGAD